MFVGDIRTIYTGFGFTALSGGKHQKYVYEKYRLIVEVGRHDTLATGYAVEAVKIIDELLALLAKEQEEAKTKAEVEKTANANKEYDYESGNTKP